MNPPSLHQLGADNLEGYGDACVSFALAYMDYDFEKLAARLRKGTCWQEELDVAADYLEGKLAKRKKGRRRSIKDVGRDIAIKLFVSVLVQKGIKKEAAIRAAEINFELPRSSIFVILSDKTDRYKPLQD